MASLQPTNLLYINYLNRQPGVILTIASAQTFL